MSGFALGEDKAPAAPHPEIKWSIELNYGKKQFTFAPDGTIYVATTGNNAVLTALTPEGKVLWSWVAHGMSAIGASTAAPKLDSEGNILVLVNDRLVKLAPDGAMLWERKFFQTSTLSPPPASLAVAPDGTCYVAAAYLNAYSPKGDLLWQFRGEQPMISVHLREGNNVEAADGRKTYVISAQGEKLSETNPGASRSLVASEGGIDYKLEWRQMSSVATSGHIFNALVVESQSTEVWEFAPGLELDNVVPQGALVFVGGRVLAALDRQSGTIRWRINTGNSVPARAVGTSVIGGCEKGSTICAYTRSGALRWAFVGTARPWFSPPATVAVGPDKTIYIADDQKTVTAVRDVVVY